MTPRLKNVNATLEPGLELGTSNLTVQVAEERPYRLGFKFNNRSSPTIGAYRGEIYGQHLNLTGWGDSLYAQYGITEGLDDYLVKYAVPLTRWDTTLALGAERKKALIVAEPFYSKGLNIRSNTKSYFSDLRHPIYRSVSQELAAGLKAEKLRSETSLLGMPFSFPGSGSNEDGKTDYYAFRLYQEWVDRSIKQVLAANSCFSLGKIDGGELDGGFFAWLGQFQWLRRINFADSQLLFSLKVQLTDDALVPAEKFSIGGASTVRGYRENQIMTDKAAAGSIEWRVPVARLRFPGLSRNPFDGDIQLCPFFDLGKGWNKGLDPEPDTLYSAGIGARWLINSKINAEIYWGKSLKSVPQPADKDIQDDGIHFQIKVEVF